MKQPKTAQQVSIHSGEGRGRLQNERATTSLAHRDTLAMHRRHSDIPTTTTTPTRMSAAPTCAANAATGRRRGHGMGGGGGASTRGMHTYSKLHDGLVELVARP
jgi:hypothetical protein